MNGWYGAAIAGLVLLVEGLANLVVNKIKKRELRSHAIRAFSGGCTLLLANLAILFRWFGADIAVGYDPLYSFSFAGFVLMLESLFSFLVNGFTRHKREAELDGNRAYIGVAILAIGLVALIITGR